MPRDDRDPGVNPAPGDLVLSGEHEEPEEMGSVTTVIDSKGPGGSSPSPLPRRADADARRREDARLVDKVRAGEIDAFETLYRRHSNAIFGLALRMVRNRADAEDLLQEIFLHAYDRLPSFEGRSAFGTWLYRLGVNRCLDHLRSRGSKEQSRNESLDLMPTAAAAQTRPAVRGLEIERAIVELPPSSRAAFLLHDVVGYDHKEVGEILGVAAGTSKSLVHRARTRLREMLSPPSKEVMP
jgi:RNA polymerase sigma-70 factor, ECF subfamily